MNEKQSSKKKNILDVILAIVCLAAAIFHIFISWNTSISIIQQRVFHVFVMILIFFLMKCSASTKAEKKFSATIYGVCSLLSIVSGCYFLLRTNLDVMLKRSIRGASDIEILFGVLLIICVMYLAWRTVGWALSILSAIFLLYAIAGPYMPDIISHRGYTIPYITNYVSWTSESIFGTCVSACVSFVALYIIFGELLDKFGAGQFFIDIAYALTGRMKGGPAEAAVVSSALMGSINGSAVANVVTTGTFTIPLMKKVGYRPEFAGAVEAVASTGGQILPPVMGAAAFVMADLTGIPYSTIIIAAIVPGILYYLSLGISVYLEADKRGLEAELPENLPQIKQVLKEGWYYGLPIITLIVALLGFNLSANYSALFSIGVLLVIGFGKEWFRNRRLPFREVFEALVKASKTTVSVTIACACAGIVIGIVSMTGIGIKFTSIVFQLSGGNIILMLLLVMLACIVMGMGLPSTAAYIIAATVGVPTLVAAGISTLAANLFVFYFAIMSFITPPVAVAAYAAAGLADTSASKTGWQAFMLGMPGFIIPFVYVFNPALLIVDTSTIDTLYIVVLATFGVILTSIAVIGWFKGKLHPIIRLLIAISAILMFVSGTIYDIIGVVMGVAIMGYLLVTRKKRVAA
ncbi:TRAP transporter permease [Murdochiella vaginalis]|uniref:TRAP transporter permease n=1 Tax=Murdochiella vaginalis TaxID=1852373 RepID=UPI0008FDDF70|nr:TRAP transporter fused permease subunit [Murdochiella vaginalis]